MSAVARFDESLLQQLEREREVYVRVTRRDGRIGELPIWIVTVDGEAYVRSYLADRGAWYRRALAAGRMTLVVRGKAMPMVVEPIEDERLNESISQAFIAKYGDRGPARTMVNEPVTATTLRVSPAERPVAAEGGHKEG
ncbi:MAG TPA: DUF2255 family protein [Candidatus Dormibacteraeota bacterium]|nr:DUF2255 family protein [Candidatus Dormibacteraeota bacterium]